MSWATFETPPETRAGVSCYYRAVHIVANMEVVVWTKPRRQRPKPRKPVKRKAETPPRKRKPRNNSRKSKSMIGAKWNSFASNSQRCKTSSLL
nr:MAG TPA: hypothetical protein [Caudoviricetes sp.]